VFPAHTRTIFAGLASKPVVTFLVVSPQNLLRRFSLILPQNQWRHFFSSLTSKLVVTLSLSLASKLAVGFLVEPQNQGGGGFPGLGLKTGSSSLVIWVSKSP
jgi:F0F1-type ATP synthase membrane subunit a